MIRVSSMFCLLPFILGAPTDSVSDSCSCKIYGEPQIETFRGVTLPDPNPHHAILSENSGEDCPFKISYIVDRKSDGNTKLGMITIGRGSNMVEVFDGKTIFDEQIIKEKYFDTNAGFLVSSEGTTTTVTLEGCDVILTWTGGDRRAELVVPSTGGNQLSGLCGACAND